jgi:hypothetical protein
VPNAKAIEAVIKTYVRGFTERDPAARQALVDSCFAVDGRLVGPAREIHGRAALADLMARVANDPQWKCVRFTSAIDIRDRAFRFSGVAERHDGTVAENHDCGVVDAAGQIELLMTFIGPLSPPAEPAEEMAFTGA